MFEALTDKLQSAFKKLTGASHISESNISDAMSEVRTALLAADVNYQVVEDFLAKVKAECLGQDVLKSVTPGQQAIKIVYDSLVQFMGEEAAELNLAPNNPGEPAIIMLCGLHGSGKTTTTAKLALFLQKKYKKRPLLAACDLQRPAAIDQLEVLGQSLSVPVYTDRTTKDVVKVAKAAVEAAKQKECPIVILDTAGRLEIDATLVEELEQVKAAVKPQEILLVADSALGQEAVSVASHFNDALSITGIILTKLDGDARGGAALSMRHTTGKPIKFMTTGENPMDLEAFHPDRMASRILGMGDILTLVERAQNEITEKEAAELEEKVRRATFGFDDFLAQISRMNKMGGLMSLLKFLPGMNQLPTELLDEKTLKRTEGIIHSMTPTERKLPETINASRRARIAKGSGVTPQEVTEQIRVFMNMREVMAKISQGGAASMASALFGGGAGLANLASMMQGGAAGPGMGNIGGAAAQFGRNGLSHQMVENRNREKAKKDAKRKAAKAARKKNRKH